MAARRRSKIVATLGPATLHTGALGSLLRAGVDVVRLNASHQEAATFAPTVAAVRDYEGRLERPIGIMLDLCGPKIRISPISGGAVLVHRGDPLVIDPAVDIGSPECIGVSFEGLAGMVRRGTRLLLDDGRLELRVVRVDGRAVHCRVSHGGLLASRKGLAAPGVPLPVDPITTKDWTDLEAAVRLGVDFIALSFVATSVDVARLQARIADLGGTQWVVAKIERTTAVRNLESIVRQADAVMVARGDLGVDAGPEAVPLLQKRIIACAARYARPVITATQMLDSMVRDRRPTRAEASDVANAVVDGTDALMLSEETAVGEHPLDAVRTMARICLRVDVEASPAPVTLDPSIGDVSLAVASSATDLALRLGAACLVVFSTTGRSARLVAACRPTVPVVAVTPDIGVARRLTLVRGVIPLVLPEVHDTDCMISAALAAARTCGAVRLGQRAVLVFGHPVGEPGSTDTVKVAPILA